MKKKVLSILLITLVLMMTVAPFCFASGELIEGYTVKADTGGSQKLVDGGNKVIGMVQVVGIIVAVVMLIVLGIRYTTATVGEKAEIKSQLLPYVVGVIFIFGAVAILEMIKAFDLFGTNA